MYVYIVECKVYSRSWILEKAKVFWHLSFEKDTNYLHTYLLPPPPFIPSPLADVSSCIPTDMRIGIDTRYHKIQHNNK